jgi:UDP-GlcNAc:undecaprenyl-phosphate GlcNAc-1-phosphate transferase
MFYQPDKEHLHHRLLEIGHSQRRAVLIMWMWAALFAGSTVVISLYTGPIMWWGIAIATSVTVALTFVLPLLQTPRLARGDSG